MKLNYGSTTSNGTGQLVQPEKILFPPLHSSTSNRIFSFYEAVCISQPLTKILLHLDFVDSFPKLSETKLEFSSTTNKEDYADQRIS